MEFLRSVGTKILAGEKEILLRGFGLGGWLLPEGYMWQLYTKCDRPRRIEEMIETLCGREYAASFWEQYLSTFITEDDIRWIAAEGFNSVRLPLNARHLCRIIDGACVFIPDTLKLVDDLIKWCRRFGVYVILDMHAAPGGQTGQNIDDSADDLPRLFMDEANRDELCLMWRAIAARYADEPAVAGYDLLNEPLPDFFSQYNDMILPLYQKLTRVIREVDTRHIVILEGAHWATDFSIFESLQKGEIDNAVLQFHKYWSTPDAESLQTFIDCASRLDMPLLMGEGGENNLAWYTAAFPLYEQKGISWSFWTYKKMARDNSPVSFDRPEGWDALIAWLDGGAMPAPPDARRIFDDLLYSVAHAARNMSVNRALKREVPVVLPCEAYDGYEIHTSRRPGADVRMSEPVTLLFASGRTGIPDYKRYDGEPQPDEENIIAELEAGESLSYQFTMPYVGSLSAQVAYSGDGGISLIADDLDMQCSAHGSYIIDRLTSGSYSLHLKCISGEVKVDTISLSI